VRSYTVTLTTTVHALLPLALREPQPRPPPASAEAQRRFFSSARRRRARCQPPELASTSPPRRWLVWRAASRLRGSS